MIAVSMFFALAFAAEARPFGPNLKGRGMRRDFGGLRAFLQLKLSDAQQAEMMAELKTVLTAEQLEFLNQPKPPRIERMRHRCETGLKSKAQ